MDIGSAWRRFGVSDVAGGPWLTPARVRACLTFRRQMEALLIFATLALGAVAVVKFVDALLDRLHY